MIKTHTTNGANANISVNSGGSWSFLVKAAGYSGGKIPTVWAGTNTSVDDSTSGNYDPLMDTAQFSKRTRYRVTGLAHSHGITQTNHSHTYGNATDNYETRPSNMSIKIWVRIA